MAESSYYLSYGPNPKGTGFLAIVSLETLI